MASLSLTFNASSIWSTKISQVRPRTSFFQSVSFGCSKNRFPSSSKNLRLRVSCTAKGETVQKVCDIVRRQLALPAETQLTSQTQFSSIGADSLDTVEIVMALEEEYDIAIEEDKAQNITTVQDAADLIDELVQKKAAT